MIDLCESGVCEVTVVRLTLSWQEMNERLDPIASWAAYRTLLSAVAEVEEEFVTLVPAALTVEEEGTGAVDDDRDHAYGDENRDGASNVHEKQKPVE